MDVELAEAMNDAAATVDRALSRLLPPEEGAEAVLFRAMRYATLNGGKRLRPFLVLQAAKLFGVDEGRAARVAAAVEMVHSYSLVHDDLPAMDDADLRRGQPSVHKKFDEAIAILAGDALLTQAFEVLAHPDTHEDAAVRCALVSALAQAAGPHGMVGGQMLDLLAAEADFDATGITRMQRMKTGEMIMASAVSGAVLGKASPGAKQALKAYAHDLGLAFQIVDDLIDHRGDEAAAGKSVGRDASQGKATFVAVLGAERAEAQADLLCRQAVAHLEVFEGRAGLLAALAGFVLQRKS
jgi:farnesyl diphosphate synthase